ncbi:MAG: metallophosphoesterase, partial [Gemmatimonadetes bacterium]|nr:metallophosphoesterase [Gemmatimonadota bacterium]
EVDVLITHGPAFGHNDTLPWTREQVGDEELLEAIERIQPKLHICGHIHCGAGTSTIGATRTINVSVVNEDYELANPCRVEEVET